MICYLAARYSRRAELCEYRSLLEDHGFIVTSRWLNGDHQISDNEMSDKQQRLAKQHFACEDWVDLMGSNIVISFTEQPRSSNSRGGRHVEFGAALANGATCYVVGPVENVFHLLPSVLVFESFQLCLLHMLAKREYDQNELEAS